jgi:hypothetical protein
MDRVLPLKAVYLFGSHAREARRTVMWTCVWWRRGHGAIKGGATIPAGIVNSAQTGISLFRVHRRLDEKRQSEAFCDRLEGRSAACRVKRMRTVSRLGMARGSNMEVIGMASETTASRPVEASWPKRGEGVEGGADSDGLVAGKDPRSRSTSDELISRQRTSPAIEPLCDMLAEVYFTIAIPASTLTILTGPLCRSR